MECVSSVIKNFVPSLLLNPKRFQAIKYVIIDVVQLTVDIQISHHYVVFVQMLASSDEILICMYHVSLNQT